MEMLAGICRGFLQKINFIMNEFYACCDKFARSVYLLRSIYDTTIGLALYIRFQLLSLLEALM